MAQTQRRGRQRNSFGPFYVRTQEGDWGPYSLADVREQHAAGNLQPTTALRDAGRNLMVTVGDLIADAVDQTKAGETAVNGDLDPIVIDALQPRGYDTTTLSATTMSATALPGHLEPLEVEPLERRWQPATQRPPSTAYAYAPTSSEASRNGHHGVNGHGRDHGYEDDRVVVDRAPPPRRRTAGGGNSRKRRRRGRAGIDPGSVLLLIGGLAVVTALLYAMFNQQGRHNREAVHRLLSQPR